MPIVTFVTLQADAACARVITGILSDGGAPRAAGRADQTSYIARSIGLGKPELESAFDQCQNKYECVCIYTLLERMGNWLR